MNQTKWLAVAAVTSTILVTLLVFLMREEDNMPSKEQVFVSRLEAAGIPVGSQAVETAKSFCQGDTVGKATLLAELFFPAGDPLRLSKIDTYVSSVVQLCDKQ